MSDKMSGVDAIRVLECLGDLTRMKILRILAGNGEVCVKDIVAQIGLAQAGVSHHLVVLRATGLVACDRHGRSIAYRVVPDTFRDLARYLVANFAGGDA